tara:strand:- start:3022 stop:3738 length:717 start_codon:yes stop_codon:yes gene_type:complete
MEALGLNTATSIAIAAVVVLLIVYNAVRERNDLSDAAADSPPNQPATGVGFIRDGTAALMSENTKQSDSYGAFRDYLSDHSPEQLDDVPVYALVHLITASLKSPSRSKWLHSVVSTIVPRGADPELFYTAEHFWDLNARWTFRETCVDDFCVEYLIARKNEWSAEVRERIVLAGLAALASSGFEGTNTGAEHERFVGKFRAALDRVSGDYFGTLAGEAVAALDGRARELAPEICAKVV